MLNNPNQNQEEYNLNSYGIIKKQSKEINSLLPDNTSPLKKSNNAEILVEDCKKLYSPQGKQKNEDIKTRNKTFELDKLIKDLTESSPNQSIYNNLLLKYKNDNTFNTDYHSLDSEDIEKEIYSYEEKDNNFFLKKDSSKELSPMKKISIVGVNKYNKKASKSDNKMDKGNYICYYNGY